MHRATPPGASPPHTTHLKGALSMSSASPSVRRPRIALPASVAAMIAILAVGIVGVLPAAAASPATPGPGFTDFVYKPDADGSGGDDVTSYRNQSKLWFNDGRWWAILF